jgi:hypothetical protein
MYDPVAKGKPVARRGRKARGLPETAQPPTSRERFMDKEVLLSYVMKLPSSRALAVLGACIGLLVTAAPAAALPGAPAAGPAAGPAPSGPQPADPQQLRG